MKENTSAVQLAPAIVLPVQLDGPRIDRISPERALMLAVLEDAIRCFADERKTPGGRQRRSVREAEAWLFDDDRRWPFSFVNICDAFDLSPPAVRVALLAGGARGSGGEGRPLSRLRVRTSPRRPRRMLTRHEARETSGGGRHLAAGMSSP